MDILKEPPFSFAVGLISGLALGYSAYKWLEAPASSSSSKTTSSTDSISALSDLLLNTSVEYLLVPNRSVVAEDFRGTIDHALLLMQEGGVVSIPVVDLEKRRYLGMLNVLDIVGFLLTNYSTNRDDEIANLSVAEVLKSNREPFLPLYATSPLALLLHVMTSLANEVPIMSAEGQITNVVTRHDLLRFVQENLDVIGPRVDGTVQSIIHLTSGAEYVETDTKVADALKLMIKKGISEVAVVDSGGKLVGNLVASDFRKFSVYNFSKINESVSKFMSPDPNSVVTVDPNASLRTIVQKFVNTKTPVIWIVDSQTRPTGCITLKSISKLILEFSMH